jgi:3-oxoadipate enol-lactonase
VVLVHEMTGSIESWDAVVPRLAGHRILRFDMRGHGGSQKIVERTTLRQFTDDLAALQDAIGFAEPAVVAGIAVGGAVALGFTAWWPQRVARAVVFSPALGVPPESRPERHDKADALERDGMTPIVDASFNAGFPEKYRIGREAEFRVFRGRLAANDSRSIAHTFRMLADLESDEFLPAIDRPVLLVGCTDDPLRPPSYVKTLADRIPGARYAEIDSGHHSAQLTPRTVADLIARDAREAA